MPSVRGTWSGRRHVCPCACLHLVVGSHAEIPLPEGGAVIVSDRPGVRRAVRMSSRRRLLLRTGFGAIALVLVLLVLAAPALAPSSNFPDVSPSHPYHAAITDLAGRTIIGGFPDGTFGPDAKVTRQQFAKMIVLTLSLPVSETDICPFTDVEKSGPGVLYPDHYVAVAAARAITVGTGPGLFSPGNNITRAQVVTMVVRAAKSSVPSALGTPPFGFAGTLGDFDTTHAGNLKVAEFNELLDGLQGFGRTWDPFAFATRGEVAQILHNLLGELDAPTDTTTTAPTTTTTAGRTYAIGDTGPAGGLIFYDKGENSGSWRYLEAAPASTEWESREWGPLGTAVSGARTTAVGTGRQNTTAVIALHGSGSAYAAQLCDSLVSGGSSDWFLPSKDELALMRSILWSQGLGGFGSDTYWSSSEIDSNNVWSQYFGGGTQYQSWKDNSFRVRAVRAF